MAYADLGDVVSGGTITEAWGDQVRANFQAGVPDIFTTKGDIAGATAADTAARLAVGAAGSVLVPDSGEATGLAWQHMYICSVYRDAVFGISSSTATTVQFNAERSDTGSMHDITTNNQRITVVSGGAGWYRISANISLGAAGTTWAAILLNGTTVIARQSHFYDTGSPPSEVDFNISRDYYLSETDYVEVQVYASAAVNVAHNANYSPEFTAVYVRP